MADLGRQVAVLLLQVQGGQGPEPVLRITDGGEGPAVTTDDVIDDRLLSFTDVQVSLPLVAATVLLSCPVRCGSCLAQCWQVPRGGCGSAV